MARSPVYDSGSESEDSEADEYFDKAVQGNIKGQTKQAVHHSHETDQSNLWAWTWWTRYFEDVKRDGCLDLIPGSPKKPEDILLPSFPQLNAATLCSFLKYYVDNAHTFSKGCVGDTRPALASVRQLWNRKRAMLLESRGEVLLDDTRLKVNLYIRADLLERGLITSTPRDASLLHPDQFETLLESMLQSDYFRKRPRYVAQTLLFLNFQLSGAIRSSTALATSGAETADHMIYGQFSMVATRAEGWPHAPNIIEITHSDRKHKTKTLDGAVFVLRQHEKGWHDGVAAFLWLAAIDNALPCPLEDIVNPDFLRLEPTRTLDFAPEKQKSLVMFHVSTGKPWTTRSLGKVLHKIHPQLGRHTLRYTLSMLSMMDGE